MNALHQTNHAVRFDWGLAGLMAIGPGADAVVVVDVLSFTTSVDIALGRGSLVYPCGWRDGSADAIARLIGGVVAGTSAANGASLSPATLLDLPAGTRLVVESVNGSALAQAAQIGVPLYASCLRNARAVAAALIDVETITVVAAGERWPDGSLRPALEDQLGAGALIASLARDMSPEAEAAAHVFNATKHRIHDVLRGCASGREKIARNAALDIELAAAVDVSRTVPRMRDGAFRSARPD